MLLVFPFAMRESINYAIRARLRGESIAGASSDEFRGHEYCDVHVRLPSIYEESFPGALKGVIEKYGITRFYTPHHLVYSVVKALYLPIEFAEGNPITIMEREYRAAVKSGVPPAMAIQSSRIYGHMNEDKLAGMVKCFRLAPAGDAFEVGCAWGKSLKMMCMLASGKVYGIDTWDRATAEQKDAHSIITTYGIDWDIMGNICKANVPEAEYSVPSGEYTVLHIDANHDYECVRRDWDLYGHNLVAGGWLILDDIDWHGVERLWGEIKEGFDSCYTAGGAVFARKI